MRILPAIAAAAVIISGWLEASPRSLRDSALILRAVQTTDRGLSLTAGTHFYKTGPGFESGTGRLVLEVIPPAAVLSSARNPQNPLQFV